MNKSTGRQKVCETNHLGCNMQSVLFSYCTKGAISRLLLATVRIIFSSPDLFDKLYNARDIDSLYWSWSSSPYLYVVIDE